MVKVITAAEISYERTHRQAPATRKVSLKAV